MILARGGCVMLSGGEHFLTRGVLLEHVSQLLGLYVFEALVFLVDVLKCLADGFGHAFMRLLRPPHDGKVFGRGYAFMSIVTIQPQTQQVGFFLRIPFHS